MIQSIVKKEFYELYFDLSFYDSNEYIISGINILKLINILEKRELNRNNKY